MGIVSMFRLFRECFQIGGRLGLLACFKFIFGAFKLPDIDVNSSVFPEGDFYV